MKERLNVLGPVLAVAALLAAACCLAVSEDDLLWKAQEMNLFLDTPLFFREQMALPAGWLSWVSAWATEFFYHQWVGISLLSGCWALLMFMTARTFRIPAKWAVVLLIPVAALLLTIVDTGYWIYYLKLRGHFFVATIGTTIAVAATWLFRLLPAQWYVRSLYMLAATLLLYPLCGFYGLLTTALMVILSWRLKDMTTVQRVVTTALGVLGIVAWPLVCYRHIYCLTNIVNIYWAGLPLYILDKEYTGYYAPYWLLGITLAVMAATYAASRQTAVRRPLPWLLIQAVVLCGVGYGVSHFWFKDYNFHKELRMQRCIEGLDWEGVRQEAATLKDEPTRAIVMMKNLALFRQGTQGNTMYQYAQGAKPCDMQIPVNMAQVVGLPLYHHYGQHNFCYRWCMEYCVELGWRAGFLKYLVRSSLAGGDLRVARKYIDMLKHTRYHREWAERYERLLSDKKALHADREFEPIFHLTGSNDVLSSDNHTSEMFLMMQFLQSASNDPLYLEQAVYSAMWLKSTQAFWPAFFRYIKSHPDQPVPIHVQEAAYLYGNLEHQVDISHMPFDKGVAQSYAAFMNQANQCGNMSEEQMARTLYPSFGQTFFYEYYFVRNLKMY